jgi:hypothetical protein
MKFGC